MLEGNNISKVYGKGKTKKTALYDTTFKIDKGEFVVLVGESGSGKTTLSRILTGVISPTTGDVFLNGKSIKPPTRRKDKSICKDIQLVLQDGESALDPKFTIFNCIAEPLKNLYKLDKKELNERVYSLMDKMGLPRDIGKRYPKELSGGQQKRVCIARALSVNPKIIIFDEAITGLDVLVRKDILELIKTLHTEQNSAYLFITHDIEIALYLANKIIVMKNGKIIEKKDYKGDINVFTEPYTKMLLKQIIIQDQTN